MMVSFSPGKSIVAKFKDCGLARVLPSLKCSIPLAFMEAAPTWEDLQDEEFSQWLRI